MLRREADLMILGVMPQDEQELCRAINSFRADVVVLDEATAGAVGFQALAEDCDALRVLVVSADDDLVHIYEARQVALTQGSELVDLIKPVILAGGSQP
jgi:hypothetical protein